MIKRLFQDTSIRLRITFIIFFILIAGLLILSDFLGKILERHLERIFGGHQFSATSMVALHIHHELLHRTETLQSAAQTIRVLPTQDPHEIQRFFKQHPQASELFRDGIFLCAFPDNPSVSGSPMRSACHDFLQNAKLVTTVRTGRALIGELISDDNAHAVSLLTAVPIYSKNGNVNGALLGISRLKDENILLSWFNNAYRDTGDYLLISPSDGTIIGATQNKYLWKKFADFSTQQLLEKINQASDGVVLTDTFASIVSILVVKKIDVNGWLVVSVLPKSEGLAPIDDLNQFLHFGVLILTAMVLLIVWIALKFQLSPLITTVKDIDDIAHNRKPFAFLPVKSQDEVGCLIASFNKLLKKLEDREEQLHQSEIFSHAILNSVPVQIAVLDQHGTITMVNEPWLQFGKKHDNERQVKEHVNAIGTNYLEVCRRSIAANHNHDAALVLEGISAVLAGRLPRFSLEYKCVLPTQFYWYSLVVTPLNHQDRGAVVSHTDITQRKQIEEALHVVWASTQATLDAIFWLDPEAKIVDINDAASRLLGYDEDELLQFYLADISPETFFDKKRWSQFFDKIKQAGAIKMETKLRCRSGKTIAVDVNSVYIQYGDKELICAFVRDITDRKRYEIALRQAKAEAEKANNAKSKFLAAASHDLRQPLSALSLYIDLLSQYKQPRIKRVVGNIQGCVDSMSELLSDLLDITKLEAGVIHPNHDYFPIDELLQKLVNIFSAESNIKNLSLHYRPSNLVAYSDQKLFIRIIGNLLSNAIRYTEIGGILFACRRHQGKYYIEVFDTGIGIAEDQLELIFEEFRQLGDDSRHRGSGLGLAIVKKMATLMGLEINVKSRVGRGSVFRMEIPVVDAVLYQDLVIEPAPSGALVALVDDNVEILNALKQSLEQIGYEVLADTSGHALSLKLEGRIPDLLISDFRLQKGENGFEVISAFRQEFGQNLPAILITGDTDPHLFRLMQEKGILTLFKPLQFKKLKSLIASLLQNGKS